MDLFIIGDVHGCLHTFRRLLDHWDPEKEQLIQLGDIIDRGNFSAETFRFCNLLKEKYPSTVLLKGNHEAACLGYIDDPFIDHWLDWGGRKTVQSFERVGLPLKTVKEDFKKLPLYWENEHVFVSHAGIGPGTADPFDEKNSQGILWYRGPLKNIGKLQVIGHTPLHAGPLYDEESKSWNIDTGACYGRKLTGIKLTREGKLIEHFSVETVQEDIDWAI